MILIDLNAWPWQAMPAGFMMWFYCKLRCLTYSSAFSGVDAPGTALHVALIDLQDRLGFRGYPEMCSPKHVRAVEWNRAAAMELNSGPQAPHCLIKDISNFWKPVPGTGSEF